MGVCCYLATGRPGKERGANKPPSTGRIRVEFQNPSRWNPSCLSKVHPTPARTLGQNG